jgi:DNA-binding transcriptional ArsR family regulator
MRNPTYVRQAELFSALAHPVRLSILDILADGEACVCHLSAALHLKQAYVSQQLARLKEAALIVDKKDGLYVYYGLADTSIVQMLDEARQILACTTGDESLLRREPPPQRDSQCPCPRCQAARFASVRQTSALAGAR